MFIGMEIHDNVLQLEQCNAKTENYFQNYFRRERPHLLIALPYYIWEIPLFQWTIMLMAFSWNYVDVFIIIVSMGLKERFVQLNNRLKTTNIHLMDQSFWSEIRLHYSNLIDLVQYMDKQISSLVLLSMSHNLFLIITKIYEAFT